MPPKKPTKTSAPDLGSLSFEYDGTKYSIPLDISQIPNSVDRELFTQSGLTIGGVLQALNLAVSNGQGGEFMLAAVVFVGKRLAGEACKHAQIEDAFDQDKMILTLEDDTPKASEPS